MMWRVRTTLADRPGILAEVADACGRREINIVSMQVFVTAPDVVDEFVVSAPDGITDVQVADTFTAAGGASVTVTRADQDAVSDPTTRYLTGVHQVIEDGRDVVEVLHELLAVEPPDVADYTGHDVLDLARRDGSVLRVSRAVPFNPSSGPAPRRCCHWSAMPVATFRSSRRPRTNRSPSCAPPRCPTSTPSRLCTPGAASTRSTSATRCR